MDGRLSKPIGETTSAERAFLKLECGASCPKPVAPASERESMGEGGRRNRKWKRKRKPALTNQPRRRAHARVEYSVDQNMPNAGTFVVRNEDHTLGNMLRSELLRNPHVLFAGYRLPHPLEHRMVIKVRTDATEKPMQVTNHALANLKKEIAHMKLMFEQEALEKANQDDQGY